MLTVSQLATLLKTPAVFILDGGMGSELEQRGVHLHTTLWSSYCIHTNPDVLKQVHLGKLHSPSTLCLTKPSLFATWSPHHLHCFVSGLYCYS